MAMRDLIPWGRPEGRQLALFGEEERSPFFQLHREMDRLFDDFLRAPTRGGAGTMSWPSLEVQDKDNEILVTAELPGMNEKDIDLSVHDGLLTISGERKSEAEDRDRGWSERYYGRFERRIALPEGADEAHCNAEFHDGVLKIRIPKSQEAARSRRIAINAGTKH